MSAWESFRNGGWAMWFISIFGALAVGAAVRFAWRGGTGIAPFASGMVRTTLFAGAFGFASGMILVSDAVVRHANTSDERLALLVQGTGEALNNVTFALLLSTLASLLLAIGERRFPRDPERVP
jgi:hypothetical protein